MSAIKPTPLVSGVFESPMRPIIEADKTRCVVNISLAIVNCLNNNPNISLQMVEHELRRNDCFSYLIARKKWENMTVSNDMPYYFHISGQSDKSDDANRVKTNRSDYNENLLRLAHSGIITVNTISV